ncbi:leucyl aminopeptidase [Propylenella binzhouense]|uniref:Probable cytosol aminopeptidase n=1 Tax=Propylenella binzhouense TaxID=2555902 RepID=A0A964T7H6_9HYPH|nr:leucyl aminopeptidase [Propylenella binzhouense]MYZ49854.1 leucyl aminopeptidase [Propylenella binzhouense]
MADRPDISFVNLAAPERGTVVFLTDKSMKLGPTAAAVDEAAAGWFARGASVGKFEGGSLKTIQQLAPAGGTLDRVVYLGLGDPEKFGEGDWLKLGGTAAGAGGNGEMTIVLERADAVAVTPEQAANVALGAAMRGYSFDRYKTKKKPEEPQGPRKIAVAVADPKAAARAWESLEPVAAGVVLARDLVNEPANVLGPAEFAERLEGLREFGVEVEVLDERDLRKEKMNALLGVARGSARAPRVVVMRWKGGKGKDKPVALVGKGVVFDTGGISIKPAAGMEDMKGDMAGAAAVAGTMRALAGRKARANVVGIVGIVENMPDGDAQRPGDIVTSLSGQTIEIINTDAEGRLVLADVLTYVQREDEPKAIVDLATLTGAIIVALGHHHAGMFANNDELAAALDSAGRETGEHVWRMPLGPDYDKLIESKFADVKNTGGRWAGSITAAQFIGRFIENETPWAHLDIAGTGMGSPSSETNQSWGSGFGVRLLDRWIRANHERHKD